MKAIKFIQKSAFAVAGATILLCSGPVLAHHGTGLYEIAKDTEYSGTLTEMELVNPHSYMHFEVTGADGKPFAMRCEMRGATLIKRSGWSLEMFVVGAHVEIKGHPHRNDTHACYLESFTLDDAPTILRNDQFSTNTPVDTSNRPLRLVSGEPNIAGDWAVEQSVLTISPSGSRDMVPKSQTAAYAAGTMTLQQIRALNPSARPSYTEVGKAAADAFRMWSIEDNPRLSCKPTSIIYDWTFDWPVNRITQTTTADGEQVIDMQYGLYSFSRRIHLGMDSHPANLIPSYAGHSIGRWEGDTLVVDTVGIAEGVLAPPTRNSDQLHVVERFTLDPVTLALKREFSAEDPVYLTAPYTSSDTVLLSDVPFDHPPCKELTPEFQAVPQ
jgi:hypothetical protein